MKPALLLALLLLAACASKDAPACRGETFQLNPTRTGALAMLPTVPVARPAAVTAAVGVPAGSVAR